MSTRTHLQLNLITFGQFHFANRDVCAHPEKSTQLLWQFVKGESYFDVDVEEVILDNSLFTTTFSSLKLLSTSA